MSFRNKVICLRVDFSNRATIIYRNLKKELKKIKWLKWDKFDDLEGNFHATLVCTSSLRNFKNIWNYLSSFKPKFNLKFDKIIILKKPRKYWKIHKIYYLK